MRGARRRREVRTAVDGGRASTFSEPRAARPSVDFRSLFTVIGFSRSEYYFMGYYRDHFENVSQRDAFRKRC